jgi:biopolymer transport protein ExbD
MARKVQEINAGSMADIAFLLLIFFLMTTTMDIDSGITRKLPPPVPPDVKPPEVKERNVYIVLINTYNQLFVEREVMNINKLCDGVKEFITNPRNNKDLSERATEAVEIPTIGPMYPSKGVVSLQNDRNTSYASYIAVQNELVRAFNELRDEFSHQHWGIAFDDLDEERQKAVKKLFPQSISEATPRNVGGD